MRPGQSEQRGECWRGQEGVKEKKIIKGPVRMVQVCLSEKGGHSGAL